MPDPSPIEQVEAQRAVRVATALLSEVTQGAVDTRRVAALLLSMEAERVLERLLDTFSERMGGGIQQAWE